MKRTIACLILVLLTGAGRVEAHAFLREADPGVARRGFNKPPGERGGGNAHRDVGYSLCESWSAI